MEFLQTTLSVGQLRCNCQILVCPKTRDAVLVDPGDDAHAILAEIASIEKSVGKLNVRALLHTHAHFDHIGATRAVKEHLLQNGVEAPQIFLHKDDEFIYSMLPKQAAMFGFRMDAPLPVDQYLQDGQELRFGSLKFTIVHTPGHSPGGACFRLHEDSETKLPETVFTGDTLFREGIGRSDLWGGDESLLLKSIRNRLFSLDDDTIAWPGHGPSTSIGHEKRKNPYV